jgi:hypothetical protein
MKLILWILIIALGVVILKYRYQIHDFTGDWGWAEKYLGGNGTVAAISLIGALLIAVGTAYPFWAIDFAPNPDKTLPGFGSR